MTKLRTLPLIAAFMVTAVAANAGIVFTQPASLPTENVVASFWNPGEAAEGTMSIRNLTTADKDRTVGQSFTITAAADVYAITLETNGLADFTSINDNGATVELGFFNPATDTQIGTVQSVDLDGVDPVSGFVTFTFDAVSLPAAGEYAFELGFIDDAINTYDDDALNFAFRRTTTGEFAGGGQISKADYVGGLPNVTLSPNANNDLLFSVQGTVPVPEPASVAFFGGIAALCLVMYRQRKK